MKWLSQIFTKQYWLAFWSHLTTTAFESLLNIAVLLVVYLVLRSMLFHLIDSVLARLLASGKHLRGGESNTGRLQTLQGLGKSVVGYVLFFIFGVLFLKNVGFDILPFITTAGVIGLAISFGAQKLVRDSISGFFIIIDNQFVVGETVTIGAVTGRVQEMGLRVTTLVDASGKEHMVTNGDITLVTNLSRYPVVDFIEVNVAASADLNKVVQAINAAGEKVFSQEGHHLREAPRVLGITAFSAASVTVRISVVSDPVDLPAEQMRVRAAVREALLAAEIPLA